jgi:hypothetical protein
MRATKPKHKDHAFRGIEKNTRTKLEMDNSEITLVKGGRLAYLSVGRVIGDSDYTFTGASALRKLAKAILREIPAPKPKKLYMRTR